MNTVYFPNIDWHVYGRIILTWIEALAVNVWTFHGCAWGGDGLPVFKKTYSKELFCHTWLDSLLISVSSSFSISITVATLLFLENSSEPVTSLYRNSNGSPIFLRLKEFSYPTLTCLSNLFPILFLYSLFTSANLTSSFFPCWRMMFMLPLPLPPYHLSLIPLTGNMHNLPFECPYSFMLTFQHFSFSTYILGLWTYLISPLPTRPLREDLFIILVRALTLSSWGFVFECL